MVSFRSTTTTTKTTTPRHFSLAAALGLVTTLSSWLSSSLSLLLSLRTRQHQHHHHHLAVDAFHSQHPLVGRGGRRRRLHGDPSFIRRKHTRFTLDLFDADVGAGMGGFPPATTTKTTTESTSESSPWSWHPTADDDDDDVHGDLARLRQGIQFAKADQNLEHAKRVETLHYMAASRRSLFPDVQRYILMPLCMAWALYAVTCTSARAPVLARAATVTSRFLLTLCTDLHFWIFVVAAPSFLGVAKRIMLHRRDGGDDDDDDKCLAVEDRRRHVWSFFAEDQIEKEAEAASCRDPVLFVMDYWTTAVAGMAVAPVLAWLVGTVNKNMGGPEPRHFYTASNMIWLRIAQLITRMAAMASVHQYPKRLFELQRAGQPRPMGFFPTAAQTLVRSLFVTAPFGLAADLYKVLLLLPKSAVKPLYGSMALLFYGTYSRLVAIRKSAQDDDSNKSNFCKLPPQSTMVKITYGIANLLLWKDELANVRPGIVAFLVKGNVKRWLFRSVLVLVGLVPLLGPMAHLKCIGNIMRIVHTHNVSLAARESGFSDSKESVAGLEDNVAQSTQWRYRLEWREPQCLNTTIDRYPKDLIYWWTIKGGVQDQIMEEHAQKNRIGLNDKFVLNRLRRDMADEPAQSNPPDRDQWKAEAMEKLRKEHALDYQRHNTTSIFDDPLGVAVEQTFGIGLGFAFDHDSPLEEGQRPSLRRLQARAAKSAIARIRQLHDAENNRNKLEPITDPVARQKRRERALKEIEDEKAFLAKGLAECVPPPNVHDSADFNSNQRVAKFFPKKEWRYKKMSSNEMLTVMVDVDETKSAPSKEMILEELKSAIEEDMRSFQKRQGSKDNENDDDDSDDDTDDWEPTIVNV